MGTKFKAALVAAVTVFSLSGVQGVAEASHEAAQPALDPSKIDYTPMGYYGPADERNVAPGQGSDTIPMPGAYPMAAPFVDNPNPSGKWVSYDTNVWESLSLPSRHPGDASCPPTPTADDHSDCRAGDRDADNDAPSGYTGPNGTSVVHGECPPQAEFIAGECWNNQQEYLEHFETSMQAELADFGVTTKRYGFHSPGGGLPRGTYLAASAGQAYNVAAVIPGADHPEQTVLVSGHYDFTDSGPAAAWDSAEGHTEVMRMAYIMADYWRKTGTRPSATIKFIPWDSEESGTFGSQDYVNNNIPPGETDKVRGYFNVDPCAGAYPAFEEGTTRQVNQVMQLANPANFTTPDGPDPDTLPEDTPTSLRMKAFNARAETIIDEVLDRLDDTLTRPGGLEVPIFVSDAEATEAAPSDRDKIKTAVGGLELFTSDYANFEEVGIPIFNFFPDYFGPHADGSPSDGGAKGLEILHTPNDNLARINRLTSGLSTTPGNPPDPSGLFASEGWAKGQEFCAQVESWYMLQPEMAGTQTGDTNAVAYFEALPNEAIQNQNVTFDASGSYQYSQVPDTDPATPTPRQPDSALSYSWDFGDGTIGTGQVANHQYAEIGRYNATLTVTSSAGGPADTMTIPITVIGSNFPGPQLRDINDGDAADGKFALKWDFSATRDGLQGYRVDEAKDYQTLFNDDASNITLNWEVTEQAASDADKEKLKQWQHSDSSTEKFRGNQFHSSPRSFWTGISPQDFNPGVQNANSFLTLKEPITVPATGQPELSFWSLFQSEGDDQGRVEVALTDGSTTHLHWDAVDVQQAVNTALGQEDPLICDPSNPDTLEQGFQSRSVDLSAFKGKQILVRFNYFLGDANRSVSQPCGWYVDDIRVGAGTFQQIGTTEADQETFQIDCRPDGTYAYRVKGVYNDGVTTAPSNVESATVTNGAKPDLTLTSDDITASRSRIIKGRSVTLRANVHNLAAPCAVDATNVRVVFKVFGVRIGEVQTIPVVPGDGTATASVVWKPNQTGERRVEVTIDPSNKIAEVDESNNRASKVFVVRRR